MGEFNYDDVSGGGAALRAVTIDPLFSSVEFNIDSVSGGGQALRDVNFDLPDGTTIYPFHPWIEDSDSNTALLAFGGWWDADDAGGSSVLLPFIIHMGG